MPIPTGVCITDWGVYNAIENGGNAPGMWRTLTKAEWVYLFSQRTDAAAKYGAATVAGVNGVVVLPDDWTLPTGLEFNNGFETGYSLNTYSAEEWLRMETAGAVFLPAAGQRGGNYVSFVGANGEYWSATSNGTTLSYIVMFTQTSLNPEAGLSPADACSVRLVKVD